jgi:hypothetical protein
MTTRLYKSLQEQTIFDVALQMYGSIEGIAWLMEDNPSLIDAEGNIPFGFSYKIREKETLDQRIVNGFNGYIPVTEGLENGEQFVLVDDNGNAVIDDGNVLIHT